MKGGFGCSPCCGTVGCTCPGFANTTNLCCGGTICLPCSITMEFIPGNTWDGGGTSLTATEKSEIQASLSLTVVAALAGLPGPYGYQYIHNTNVSGRNIEMGLAVGTSSGCSQWYIPLNYLSGYADVGPWQTLSSGRWINDFTFYALPYAIAFATGGFSLTEWCSGSFDKTISWASRTFDSYVNVGGSPGIALVRLSGNTVRYTW